MLRWYTLHPLISMYSSCKILGWCFWVRDDFGCPYLHWHEKEPLTPCFAMFCKVELNLNKRDPQANGPLSSHVKVFKSLNFA